LDKIVQHLKNIHIIARRSEQTKCNTWCLTVVECFIYKMKLSLKAY